MAGACLRAGGHYESGCSQASALPARPARSSALLWTASPRCSRRPLPVVPPWYRLLRPMRPDRPEPWTHWTFWTPLDAPTRSACRLGAERSLVQIQSPRSQLADAAAALIEKRQPPRVHSSLPLLGRHSNPTTPAAWRTLAGELPLHGQLPGDRHGLAVQRRERGLRDDRDLLALAQDPRALLGELHRDAAHAGLGELPAAARQQDRLLRLGLERVPAHDQRAGERIGEGVAEA